MKAGEKKLRSGFSTGACAAAAAKAATVVLLGGNDVERVEIPFPSGERYSFGLHSCSRDDGRVSASVIKDGGDDPDVTNGAEIIAVVKKKEPEPDGELITIAGGRGVGRVTKPGLPVEVGEPAINPVPRKMIRAAVKEAMAETGSDSVSLEVTVSVTDGERLAEKTLNKRLGIIGGLSILGTTGIVRPVSAKA